jgi:hypothetical protein
LRKGTFALTVGVIFLLSLSIVGVLVSAIAVDDAAAIDESFEIGLDEDFGNTVDEDFQVGLDEDFGNTVDEAFEARQDEHYRMSLDEYFKTRVEGDRTGGASIATGHPSAGLWMPYVQLPY